MACLKSLDSGLRRAATGILPSCRIQDFLSINDGAFCSLPALLLLCSSAVCFPQALNHKLIQAQYCDQDGDDDDGDQTAEAEYQHGFDQGEQAFDRGVDFGVVNIRDLQ